MPVCVGAGGTQRHDIFTNTDFIDIANGLRCSISPPETLSYMIILNKDTLIITIVFQIHTENNNKNPEVKLL